MKVAKLILLLTTFVLMGASMVSARSFTDPYGRTITGDVVWVATDTATIRLDGGKQVVVPFARLSKADIDYLKNWAVENPDAAQPASRASTLHAKLSKPAERYDEACAKFAETRDSAIEEARETYLVKLQEADGKATEIGDVEGARLVADLRTALGADTLLRNPPEGLSKKLQSTHEAYIKAFDKANDALAKGSKKIHADYLIALGTLHSRAAGDPELLAAIAEEKSLLLGRSINQITDTKSQLKGTHWALITDPEDVYSFGENGRVNEMWNYGSYASDQVTIFFGGGQRRTWQLDLSGRLLLLDGKPDRQLVGSR